jgi:predicted small metal-binding protein
MAKVIHCKDAGFECEGVLKADSEEEVLKMAAEHAKKIHGVSQLSDEMVQKVKAIIRDE